MLNLKSWGPVTLLLVAIVVIVVLAGAVLVVIQPSTLSFGQFVDYVKDLAVALGLLGVGNGIAIAGQAKGTRAERGLKKP